MASYLFFFQKIWKTSIFYNVINFTRGIDRSGGEVSRRKIRIGKKAIFFIYSTFSAKKTCFWVKNLVAVRRDRLRARWGDVLLAWTFGTQILKLDFLDKTWFHVKYVYIIDFLDPVFDVESKNRIKTEVTSRFPIKNSFFMKILNVAKSRF